MPGYFGNFPTFGSNFGGYGGSALSRALGGFMQSGISGYRGAGGRPLAPHRRSRF